MTSFDGRGSTATTPHPADPDGPLPDDAVASSTPDRDHPDPAEVPEPAVSENLFDLLAAKGEEAAQGTALAAIYGFERNFILMCRSDVQEPEFKKYQRAAVPKNKRKSQNISPWEVEQRIMAQAMLFGTARELWIQTRNGYQQLPTKRENPLEDPDVLAALREVTPYGALGKLFGRNDALLIRAGQRLQVAAGWLDPSAVPEEEVGDDDDDIVDSGSDPYAGSELTGPIRRRQDLYTGAVYMLAADGRVQLATRYAKAFRGLDPVALLRDWDYRTGMIREAALLVHTRDEEQRAAREKAAARRKR